MNRSDKAIRVLTTLAVLVVAGIAAVISFTHIAHLALTHGQTFLAAMLLPLSIDGTVAASSLVMLRSARMELPTPKLARVMLALAVLATLACNVLYGAGFGIVGALLSGWPAVAFIGCAEMAIGMIRRVRSVAADDVPDAVPATVLDDTARTVAPAVLGAVATPPAPEVARAVARRRADLASGLYRLPKEVWPKTGDEAAILDLWVADKGALAEGAGAYPLLDSGFTDVFRGVPFGRTPRGTRCWPR